MRLARITALFVLIHFRLHFSSASSPQQAACPPLVTDALSRNEPIHYFGLGSNMLRSEIENRGINGTRIEILDMEPGVVPNYRLAFNLRGFPPLEPGMGSLEPTDSGNEPLLAYDKPECHGALVTLSPENYLKLVASEGLSHNSSDQQSGCEEIVVWCIPYNTSKPAVQAIALRARPHMRLSRDPCPSERYMQILQRGALELQLEPSYQAFLQRHPVQTTPLWLKSLAVHNFIALVVYSECTRLFNWRGLMRLQSQCLIRCHVPSTQVPWKRRLGNCATAALLLPGALDGFAFRAYFRWRGMPLYVTRVLQFLDVADESKVNKNSDAN